MPREKSNCFFLDVCILLPQSIKRYANSCAEFLKEVGPKCCVSSSVKETVLTLLDDAYDWIAKDIQNSLFPYMKKHSIKKVASRNGLAFERFFEERRRRLQAERSPAIYFEIVGQIEHWTAAQVHDIPRAININTEDFVAEITFELSRIYEALKSPIDAIEGEQIAPSAELKTQVASQGITKMEDVIHLASAINYQFTNNVWVVFVTFDERHILSHKERLLEVCALHCSKPAYAQDHLITLSREKRPIQYYLGIGNYSPQQKSFAKAVEESLHVKIMP